GPSTASVADAANVYFTPGFPLSDRAPACALISIVTCAGTVTVGGVESTTPTVKTTGVAAFPAASLAVQVTFVLPNANEEPDAGKQIGTRSPSTASDAAGLA